MSFKSLLVAVQPTPACDQALPHIVDFAKMLGADLTGLAARAPFYLEDPWIMSGEILQDITDSEEAQLKEAQTRFLAATRGLDARAHFKICRDYPNIALNAEAAGADLILAIREKGPEASTVGLSSLVLEAGLPVLALPDPTPRIRTDHIVIAWRNTADARRAVSAALPLLKAAQTVSVLQIVRSQDADDAWVGLRGVRERLRLHGIEAGTDLVFKDGEEVDSEVLLKAVAERMSDMIVLGGYGHARAREWILGGMTQEFLGATTIPLFMVH